MASRAGAGRHTINDNAVGFAERCDFTGIESAGRVQLPETRTIDQVEDETDMARISRIIKVLKLFNSLFCQGHRPPVNRGPLSGAFFE